MQNQPGKGAIYQFVPINFPPGQRLRILSVNRSQLSPDPITVIHSHDHIEIGFCYSGSGIFLVEGHVYPFVEGAVSVFLPGQRHRAQSSPGSPCEWNFFWVDLKQLLSPLPVPEFYLVHHPIFAREESPLLSDLVRNTLMELEHGIEAEDTVVRGLLWSISGILARFNQGNLNNPQKVPATHQLLRAMDYLSKNYEKDLSIPQLAAISGMSLSSFRRHFHLAVGKSPLQYLTEVRIELAALMLRQRDYSILETSLAVGYESTSTFYRHFKSIKGLSPQKFKMRI